MKDKIPLIDYPDNKYTIYNDNGEFIQAYTKTAIHTTPVLLHAVKYYTWYIDMLTGIFDTFDANGFKDSSLYSGHVDDLIMISKDISNLTDTVKILFNKSANGCKLYNVIEELHNLSDVYTTLTDRHPWVLDIKSEAIDKVHNDLTIVEKIPNVVGELKFLMDIFKGDEHLGILPYLTRVSNDELGDASPLAFKIQDMILSPMDFLDFHYTIFGCWWDDDYKLYIKSNNLTSIDELISHEKLANLVTVVDKYLDSVKVSDLTKDDIEYIAEVLKMPKTDYIEEITEERKKKYKLMGVTDNYHNALKKFASKLGL